ncbi:MAG: hypothetical protein MJ191_00235 [Clostridium sp.]|nr:hypothetical protein [Clostridium sp.]
MSLDLKLKTRLPEVDYTRGVREGVHTVKLQEVEEKVATSGNTYLKLIYTDVDSGERIIHNLYLESKAKPEFEENTQNALRAITNALAEQEDLEVGDKGTLADVLTIGHIYKVVITRDDHGYKFNYALRDIETLESFKNTDVAPF